MKKVIFTLIIIATFFLTPLTSEATHFRYGNITWTRMPGTRTVTFTVTTAWKYDFTEDVNLNFGDGTVSNRILGTEILYVANNYRVFQTQITHTYTTDGPFTVSFDGCCRISSLVYGADDTFTVSSIVCLSNNNLGSPVCSSPVIIEMAAGSSNQYQLITSEPDSSPINYTNTAILSTNYTPSRGGYTASVSPTGLISWNTTGAVEGQLYQMKVTMSDGCAATEIDFIIKVTATNSVPQLLACYKFDGNAQDSKGLHHGTVNGATLTTDRFGKANAAYNFDGISNNIQLSNQNDFGITTFTWSAWVNASEIPAYGLARTILSVGNDGSDQFMMLLNNGATNGPCWNYGSYTGYGTSAFPFALTYFNVVANNWVHFVIVRTLTDRKIYINGQLVFSNTASSPIPPTYSTPILATIGSRYNSTQVFKGKIDDVKIYKGTLTDEEVLLLYNEEQGECSAPCSGMIYSLGSGNWNTPATWSCGRVPDLTDKVLIKSGHTITISTNDAKAKKLVDNGQITFANSTSKLSFGTSPVTPTTIALILQPGPTDGKDSEISSYSPNIAGPDVIYTNIYAWTIGGGENIKRCFFGYDLSSIPTNAVVDSAFFSLYFSQAFINGPQGAYYLGHTVYGGDNAFFINRITGNWTESGVTWNTQPTFSTANQVSIAPFTDYRQDYPKMNVKSLVADMVANPANSYGFMLRHQVEAIYKITIFATSDDPNSSVRPKLQVYYHLP